MSNRLLALENVVNCRDFGGYETRSGLIKRGKLYRSAHFAEASDADQQKLDGLGVAVVVDLRRPEEREGEPNVWPGEKARTIANDQGRALGLPPHLMALLEDDVSPASVARVMKEIYAAFPFTPRYVDLFRAWFEALAREDGACLVHCAAGKDRTGLICALTLDLLGASEDDILADYKISNSAIDLDDRIARIRPRIAERLGRHLDDETLRPMVGVHADYLDAALGMIKARHQTIERYLSDKLGIDASMQNAIRARLVES